MTNCEWLSSKLEAYFCDDLAGEELRRFQTHLASCQECSQEVESLKQIDPLVRSVLQHRLAIAKTAVRTNGRPRVFKLALAIGGTLAAAILLGVYGMRSTPEPSAPPVASQPPAIERTTEPDGIKKGSGEEQNVRLGKPLDGTPVNPALQPHLDDPLVNGPEFAITDDRTGYSQTLETYRGRVLLFGVVSPAQKAAVSNLEQIYEDFGSNGGVAILAVARHRKDDLRGAKVPLFFNNGSKLLGAGEGEFRLVDAKGKTKLEGSLSDPADLARIKSELGQPGIR
jgi:hypothetical protein